MADSLYVIESFASADSRPRVGAFTVNEAVVHPASRSEILSAVRAHLDYEAAADQINKSEIMRPEILRQARAVVAAALGLTEEGT